MAYSYIQQSDVEAYLDVSLTGNGQVLFNNFLPMMMDVVDQYCNRTWNFANPVVEYFNSFEPGNPRTLQDTFFPKAFVSETPADNWFPQAGGVISIVSGATNGQSGLPVDLTYCFSYKTYIKVWSWNLGSNFFNPFGYKSVQITYNSDDAQNVPNPVKLALIQWIGRIIQEAPDAGKEVIKTQAGTVQAQYVADKVGGMPNFVKLILDNYVLIPVSHQ